MNYQCPHCSRPIVGNEAFCPHCGGRLSMAAGTARSPEIQVPAPTAAPGAGSRLGRVMLLVGAAVVLGVLYIAWNGSGVVPILPGPGPVSANVPPVGQIWFGRSFDPTSLEVRLRLHSVGANEAFVAVGRLPRAIDASQLQVRAYLDGQLVASQTINATGESDTWGVNLGPLFQAGEWRYEFADIGGNMLARGAVTVR